MYLLFYCLSETIIEVNKLRIKVKYIGFIFLISYNIIRKNC